MCVGFVTEPIFQLRLKSAIDATESGNKTCFIVYPIHWAYAQVSLIIIKMRPVQSISVSFAALVVRCVIRTNHPEHDP
jgi:hypothetical protein